MESSRKKFCKRTGQKVPKRRDTILRIVYESLAIKYSIVNSAIEKLTGKKTKRIHIVGGGARNSLLNRFSASAAGIPVIAGPLEATAIGNILIQAKTLGIIKSFREGTELVKEFLPVTSYQGEDIDSWNRAIKTFKNLMRVKGDAGFF